ncbi:MAG: peptide deformylase [Alistipes sp.]|nr:peptide deformylase [Alistipes sp.]
MIYPIVIYGSQILRNESVDITPDYPELKKLIDDMWITLAEAEGVGLAAPQIGKNIRLFIVDCTPWGEDDPTLADYKRVFINPEIYEESGETSLFEEGCLSLPGLHENVRRPVAIRMRYLDENFVEHDEEFTGKPARVIQHEYDHIEGLVFTDHLAPIRKNLIKNKLQKMARGSYKAFYKTKR